jgi:hypothetical protein
MVTKEFPLASVSCSVPENRTMLCVGTGCRSPLAMTALFGFAPLRSGHLVAGRDCHFEFKVYRNSVSSVCPRRLTSLSRSCWEWRRDSSQCEGGPPNRGATNGGAISLGFHVHATTSSIDKPRFVCSPLQTGLPLRTPSAADQILLTPDISASTKCSRFSFADQVCETP